MAHTWGAKKTAYPQRLLAVLEKRNRAVGRGQVEAVLPTARAVLHSLLPVEAESSACRDHKADDALGLRQKAEKSCYGDELCIFKEALRLRICLVLT